MFKVGSRVEVSPHGHGTIALDNEDGTWNVEFDDDTEGDFEAKHLKVCADQSLPQLLVPELVMESGARRVRAPESERKPEGWTRFVCFSDTHGKHDAISKHHYYPEADVLLHAGDFTMTGELEV